MATERPELCKAEEWQRDGRGLWAMRTCEIHGEHSRHLFGRWRYHVQPPGEHRSDPICGEDHVIGSRLRDCFACLDGLCDELLEVVRIEQALQMRGYTKATAKSLGPEAEDAYLCGGAPGLNNWRRHKREAAIEAAAGRGDN
jgi:hypothetical protein